jgi:hypothetical protein
MMCEGIVINFGDSNDNFARCLCGNEAWLDGFFPSSDMGNEVEPTPEDWDNHYTCGRCGIVWLADPASAMTDAAFATYVRHAATSTFLEDGPTITW